MADCDNYIPEKQRQKSHTMWSHGLHQTNPGVKMKYTVNNLVARFCHCQEFHRTWRALSDTRLASINFYVTLGLSCSRS